eukprot:1158863-Pelagomonas_calceolata.AAC.4
MNRPVGGLSCALLGDSQVPLLCRRKEHVKLCSGAFTCFAWRLSSFLALQKERAHEALLRGLHVLCLATLKFPCFAEGKSTSSSAQGLSRALLGDSQVPLLCRRKEHIKLCSH